MDLTVQATVITSLVAALEDRSQDAHLLAIMLGRSGGPRRALCVGSWDACPGRYCLGDRALAAEVRLALAHLSTVGSALDRGHLSQLLTECLPYMELAASHSTGRRTPNEIAVDIRDSVGRSS